MVDILKASTIASFDGLIRSELWLDAAVIGSFVDPASGRTLPQYDLTGYTIRHVADRAITRREQGIHRVYLPDTLGKSGRTQEFLDKAQAQRTYALTRAEQLALRSATPSGLPSAIQLGWEREIHGPMSPTFEQSIVAENEAAVNGLTFTVVAPTSGNLLVICHGNADGNSNSPSVSAGFTANVTATPANFGPSMNILSKISGGAEGTSIVVTHTTSEADANSGAFFEISGMATTSFTDGFNSSADTGSNTTSRSSGSVTTTQAYTLLIAAWGMDMLGSPTGFGYSNSFTQQAFIDGLAGAGDHGTRVAVLSVAATGTYVSTNSWTGTTRCSGVLGAFVIDSADPPVNTVPTTRSTSSLLAKAIVGMSVAAGTSPITTVMISVPTGKGVWTLTTSGSVLVAGNGSDAVVLTGGASAAEYNTVLASATFKGASGVHDRITATLFSSDGTATDSDNFTLANDPRAVTFTVIAANFALLQTLVANLDVWLDEGETSDTATVSCEDADTLADTQLVPISFATPDPDPPPGGGDGVGNPGFHLQNLAVPTPRRDRR